jgi:hypothetical protein
MLGIGLRIEGLGRRCSLAYILSQGRNPIETPEFYIGLQDEECNGLLKEETNDNSIPGSMVPCFRGQRIGIRQDETQILRDRQCTRGSQ